jgi:L-cystine uptake protein TcyP (sodium:dicarboxylate symporter family)
MLTEEEKQFVKYWEENRLRQKSWKYRLLTGLPLGILFSAPIMLLLMTARFWYKRADMMANTIANPVVMILAVLIIAVFVAIFFKAHRWEMSEQLYQGIKARERVEEAAGKGQESKQL